MWGTILTCLELRRRKMKPSVRVPRLLVEIWIWDPTSWELQIEWQSWFNHLHSSRDEYGLWSSLLLNFFPVICYFSCMKSKDPRQSFVFVGDNRLIFIVAPCILIYVEFTHQQMHFY